MNSLSDKFNWTTKAATRERAKGRASGGQVVGIKNNIIVRTSEPFEKKNHAYKGEPGVYSQLLSCSIRPLDV